MIKIKSKLLDFRAIKMLVLQVPPTSIKKIKCQQKTPAGQTLCILMVEENFFLEKDMKRPGRFSAVQ